MAMAEIQGRRCEYRVTTTPAMVGSIVQMASDKLRLCGFTRQRRRGRGSPAPLAPRHAVLN